MCLSCVVVRNGVLWSAFKSRIIPVIPDSTTSDTCGVSQKSDQVIHTWAVKGGWFQYKLDSIYIPGRNSFSGKCMDTMQSLNWCIFPHGGSWSFHRLHPTLLSSSAIGVAPTIVLCWCTTLFNLIICINVCLMSSEWLQLANVLNICWAQEDTRLAGVLPGQRLLVQGCHLWVQ